MSGSVLRRLCLGILLVAVVAAARTASAQLAWPQEGVITMNAKWRFNELIARLEQSIQKHGMALVASASASRGAASRGVKIPGNVVLMVFRNDYAVRMLEASIPAGIEAPLRLYVTENTDGTTSVSYRKPSAVFGPYRSPRLDALAAELDPIFSEIVRDAVAQ